MLEILLYQDSDRNQWDSFVKDSVNGTFLHNRSYMEYHRDRFEDHSLMIKDEKGRLLALLPGNARDKNFYSHQGLTYGGLVHAANLTTLQILDIFDALVTYLSGKGFHKLYYKTIPRQYYKCDHDGDHYALFVKSAVLFRRDVYSVVDLNNTITPSYGSQRIRALKNAAKRSLSIVEAASADDFHGVLSGVLQQKYQMKATHTAAELNLLKGFFPENIRVFECRENDKILAGVTMYEKGHAVHAQYIASSPEGQDTGALDYLFDSLLAMYKQSHRYFSFGISNEDDGRYLNRGLINQKEGFGARSVIHDHYVLDLTNIPDSSGVSND